MTHAVSPFPTLIQRLFAVLEPWLPLLAFLSGVASFFLVDRQDDLAKWIVLGILLGWVWLLLERLLRRAIRRITGYEVPPVLGYFAVQVVHQETFFFVMPFFFFTTTWDTGQALFTGLLALAGLVSIVDPLYFRQLARRKWLYMLYHGLAVFTLTLTALPIMFEMSTGQSYLAAVIALVTVTVLTLPDFIRSLPSWGWSHWLAVLVLLPALAALAWWGRYWVPPATLWVERSAITDRIFSDEKLPGISTDVVQSEDLHGEGLYAYAAIRAPRGLRENIFHVWRHNGEIVDRIALQITGGREAGYRAWTHKLAFPADSIGDWSVQVLTDNGQMIGVLRFRVE